MPAWQVGSTEGKMKWGREDQLEPALVSYYFSASNIGDVGDLQEKYILYYEAKRTPDPGVRIGESGGGYPIGYSCCGPSCCLIPHQSE